MEEGLWVYTLRCSDGSYYVGSTKQPVAARVWQHNQRLVEGCTSSRTPVVLAHCEHFDRFTEGFDREQQLKGWSRAKKEALISRNDHLLPELAKSRTLKPEEPSS